MHNKHKRLIILIIALLYLFIGYYFFGREFLAERKIISLEKVLSNYETEVLSKYTITTDSGISRDCVERDVTAGWVYSSSEIRCSVGIWYILEPNEKMNLTITKKLVDSSNGYFSDIGFSGTIGPAIVNREYQGNNVRISASAQPLLSKSTDYCSVNLVEPAKYEKKDLPENQSDNIYLQVWCSAKTNYWLKEK